MVVLTLNSHDFLIGKPLILDFFLEDSDVEFKDQLEQHGLKPQAGAASGSTGVDTIFKDMEKALSPSLVAKIAGIFRFKIAGQKGFCVTYWKLIFILLF